MCWKRHLGKRSKKMLTNHKWGKQYILKGVLTLCIFWVCYWWVQCLFGEISIGGHSFFSRLENLQDGRRFPQAVPQNSDLFYGIFCGGIYSLSVHLKRMMIIIAWKSCERLDAWQPPDVMKGTRSFVCCCCCRPVWHVGGGCHPITPGCAIKQTACTPTSCILFVCFSVYRPKCLSFVS